MGSIGKIISTKISNYVIHTIASRLGFNIEASLFSPSGIDSPGLPDDKAFIVRKDGSGKYVALGVLNVSQGAKAGELILYSRDSDGATQSKAYLNQSGEIVFNDGSDYAVAFEDLKTEFEKLQNAWDTFAAAYVPGSPTSTGTPASASASGSVIDNCKVTKVRLP